MFGGGQRGGLLPRSRALKALLVCLLALAAATLHSRGDACRGLATARGTLALANATLTNGHEVVTRGLNATVLEPTLSLASAAYTTAYSRAPMRAARLERTYRRLGRRFGTLYGALAAVLSPLLSPLGSACAGVLTFVLDRLEGARVLLTAPAARYVAELDATCAPPPKCHFGLPGICLWE